MWRMGDGVKVNVCDQKWIPSTTHMQVQDPNVISYDIQIVHQLIISGNRRWNEELINNVFSAEDVEAITLIPLYRREAEDSLYWRHEPRGLFHGEECIQSCLASLYSEESEATNY